MQAAVTVTWCAGAGRAKLPEVSVLVWGLPPTEMAALATGAPVGSMTVPWSSGGADWAEQTDASRNAQAIAMGENRRGLTATINADSLRE